ncbi:MAG: oxidoreductase [Verrucomicrobia bacterium]|nr:oxidoreductase [Verrucomicrobiota bacterium]
MNDQPESTRRNFIKSTAVAGALAAPGILRGDKKESTLRVGLVGCGGRGTGAASQAMKADPNVRLVAMGDLFQDRIDRSWESLKGRGKERFDVKPENKFLGFDAYKKVIEMVDVVILTTPPLFRPMQLEQAVNQGRHVFFEKPVAVDATGVRKVIELAKKAKAQNTAMMSGFCWRYHYPKRAVFNKILEGAIGDIRTVYTTYNTGPVWKKKRQEGWSDWEAQLRNWTGYTWLSGDSIVEQAVHSLDMAMWAMGEKTPVKAVGTGGRQTYDDSFDTFGNIYDHFGVTFEFEDESKLFHFSRQQRGTAGSYECEVHGSKGIASGKNRHAVLTDETWRYRGPSNDMYQTEHNELFASIRENNPINDGQRAANSTLLAILGRTVAYTGQTISWEKMLNSKEDLSPPHYDFDKPLPVAPIATPGVTKFV